MGRFSLYTSFVGVASVATTLRYELAIVAAQNDREAFHLAVGSMMLAIPMSFALGVALYALISAGVLGYNVLTASVAVVAPISLILTAAFLVVRQLLVREQRFKLVSHGIVWQSATRGLAQLALGPSHLGWFGLLAGDLVGRASALARLVAGAWTRREQPNPFDWHFLRRTFRTYREYATISFPSALLDTIGTNLPLPLIIHYFGAAAGGQFALVQLVFALPLTLLGSGIGDVFYSRVAIYARSDKDGVRKFFLRTTGVLFLLGAIPFALIAFLGPTLLLWLFGKQWHTAGVLAAVMTPWALGQLVVSPVSRIVFVVRGQRLKLYYDAASLILAASTLWLTASLGLPLVASVAWLSAAQLASYALYYVLILQAIDVFARPISTTL